MMSWEHLVVSLGGDAQILAIHLSNAPQNAISVSGSCLILLCIAYPRAGVQQSQLSAF